MYSSVHSCSTVRTYLLLSWVKLNSGRCQFDSSARSSKIKIRTSSRPKANELATSGHGQIRSWSLQTRAAAPRARDAWNFPPKIYEIPRAAATRAWCASSLPVKYTVLNLVLNLVQPVCTHSCRRACTGSSTEVGSTTVLNLEYLSCIFI